ncbi:MAG: SpaA isopeptide-forming pilin-related protein [Clostridia bacterium]
MKLLNKKLMLLMMGIIVMLLALLTGKVQAASQEFGLQEYRKPVGSTQYGYKVSDKYVWKIVTYSGSAINYDRTLYCLKAEQGFYTSEPGVFKETYNLSYDFMNKNSMSPLPVPSQYYNQIVWILNHSYIPSASTASTDKTTLLQNAGITGTSELTDDDIDVVQQLAIWYFTNYDDSTYHKDMVGEASFQTVLQSTKTSGGTSAYQAIEDINQTRYDQMDKLFVYLVENAKKATASSNSTSSPIAMGNTTPTVEVSGSNYIVGPFKIDKNNDTPYTINFSITDQSGKSLAGKYTLLDSNKSQTSQTLAQLVGSNFYLRIPISTVNSENITSLRFSMNGNYTITTATYWTKSGDSTVQPIVELGRTPKAFSGNKEVTFPKEGSYNLKLIKVEQGNTTNKLQGATFRITSPNGTVTETTSSNGEINVGPITINTPGTDTITIEETQAPDGYEKVITAPINVQVTKTLSSNTYTMSNAVITNTQTGSSISVSGSTITVTVENKLIPKDSEYNLKLVKVEQGNTSKKLQGAEFRINSPTGEVTQTTNASGEINIGPIAVTATGTDTITIEETKAPDGYEKIITAPITVQVTKVFENNTYKMSTAQITNAQTGASLTLSGNTITVTVENKLIPKTSEYNLKLIKVEEGTSNKLEGAEFKINSPNGEVTQTTNASGEINIGPIAVTATGTDTITIEETKAPAGYEKIITAPITVQVTKVFENNTYKMSDAVITNAQNGADISLSGNTITVTVENKAKYFDLALRKYITQVNGENVANTRVPVIDTTSLTTGTTASYKHRKDPVAVTTGDKVIYNLTIYNEGQKAGRATKIEDQLPTGLVFNRVVSGNFELDSYSETDNLLKLKRTSNTDNLDAYNGTTLDSETIQIECTVTAVPTYKEQILTNVAWISEEYDAESNVTITNEENADRDSVPGTHPDVNKDNMEDYTGNNNKEDLTDEDYYYKGQEDDDDFEKLKLVYFDLSLRKFITGRNDTTLTNREPQVDVTHLADGTSTTATYNHPKNPIDMQRGDIVIYTIRVYNEGSMDGYANEITDYLPEELEFLPDHEINQEYEWQVSSDGRHVTTDYLSKAKETSSRQNLLKAFDGTTLDYKDVKIACKIKDTAEVGKKLTNLAEITESKDSDGNDVVDRDSETDNVEVPTDKDLPNYKDDEIDKDYVPGQEDDDDFEKVKVVYFDLALRKFITAVDDTEITNRIPQLSMGEDGNIDYNHTKEPVEVENGNIVTYTLRIYNEGMMAGYASKVKDDVPDGLEFLPDNEINKEYRWVLSEDGKSIETDYLSKEQEQTEGSNLIKAFDPELGITDTNPDYRDLKIAFRVTEPNTSDRILVNTAEISDDRDENNDPVDDIDSTPDNNNEWNEEDDLDKEFVKVKYFDLALKKWVSRAIVTNQDGSQNIIETGHTGDEDPEPPAKVDLGRQDINKVTVKFEFQIKITNEGEIAGYATEVTDYIPEGLKFIQEDNPLWYPREPLNGRERVGTTQLADTLLQPGESATISILLTWINDPNNMGLKTNIAEISQDDNDSDTPDIDSTPDNFTDGEDDIDDAPVMLTVALGDTQIYIGLGFIIVAMLTGGIWAIKRYVL